MMASIDPVPHSLGASILSRQECDKKIKEGEIIVQGHERRPLLSYLLIVTEDLKFH